MSSLVFSFLKIIPSGIYKVDNLTFNKSSSSINGTLEGDRSYVEKEQKILPKQSINHFKPQDGNAVGLLKKYYF